MELDEGDQAVLDELWDGEFLLPDEEALPSASEPAFGAAAGEDDAPASRAQRAYRCLDSSHAAECRLCTQPPSAREASRWELRGDPGCVRAPRPLTGRAGRAARCCAGLRGAPAASERSAGC
jgi:hypothetical protein